MINDPLAYLQALALPDAPARSRAAMLESLEPSTDFSSQRVVAVGSQLAEFGTAVTPAQRSAVSDCLLLAQLAANRAASMNTDVMAWYAKYVEVLQNVGWTVSSLEFKDTVVGDANTSVHEAIVPVLTAALGPVAAASSLILSVLNGLKSMNTQTPWITLFDRSSSHASGAKFQLGSVDLNAAAGQVSTQLAAVAITAEKQITQVLFFKVAGDRARLRTAEGQLQIEVARLASIQSAVAKKVEPFLLDNIAALDLGPAG